MALRIALALVMAFAALAFTAAYVTPWPSVLVIRAIFDAGADKASEALQKHVPADLITRSDIPYDPSDPDARLDVHLPPSLDPARPTIVWVHGGGFVSGRRGDIANYLKVLAGRGFAVVNVDYTIAPEAAYPTPVRQVASALAYLDRHAGDLEINRQAFVLAGDSAGAQIAAQVSNLITAPAYAEAVGIDPPIDRTQIRGALLFCGVYDVELLGTDKGGVLGWFLTAVTWAYSGSRDWRSVPGFELVSVARHVTAGFPPAFVSAGNADPLAPQSHALVAALTRLDVPVEALFFPDAHVPALGHEYQFDIDGEAGRLALERAVAWLEGLR